MVVDDCQKDTHENIEVDDQVANEEERKVAVLRQSWHHDIRMICGGDQDIHVPEAFEKVAEIVFFANTASRSKEFERHERKESRVGEEETQNIDDFRQSSSNVAESLSNLKQTKLMSRGGPGIRCVFLLT